MAGAIRTLLFRRADWMAMNASCYFSLRPFTTKRIGVPR